MSKKIKFIIITVAVIMLLGGTALYYVWSLLNSAYQGETVRIFIPRNSTSDAVRDSLHTRLGDFGVKVYNIWSARDGSPQRAHGSYVVKPGERALSLSNALRSGHETPLRVSFNNIRTLDALAERISGRMELSSDEFLSACDSILPAKGFKQNEYIAAFLPDTYEFYWSSSAENVVKKLSGVRDAFWNESRRAKASEMGLTPVKIATLASIVEEETAKSDERGKVARLYINRLSKGMLLQADPTVKYAVGDFALRRILGRHLSVDSPYNTYKYAGLPPGPIRMPERKTLEAVLDAPLHPFLYMCAKEDFSGYHNFSTDYATHLDNARRYQRELNRRGIK